MLDPVGYKAPMISQCTIKNHNLTYLGLYTTTFPFQNKMVY